MYEETVLINELMDGYPDINIVGAMAIELGEPLVADEVEERIVVPRNSNYYEETIPQYMGDLLVDHFRMSRGAFEQLTKIMQNTGLLPRDITIPVEKRLLFTIWVLAKPESFLAAGDRFGFAKSKANGVFKEMVNIFVSLLPQFITWPHNHAEAEWVSILLRYLSINNQ
ncbi:rap gtpase-activating protein [Holotrichia oblita]|uniref:Rap gtpase-activating protein n=1 Tax=Holotrichia oblita TaxID=644536 RepID=A0ACB9T894_HOLOL|nr:rap gtpase-activating protein [Holotrichia oblita]